jgi:hypothetical protein
VATGIPRPGHHPRVPPARHRSRRRVRSSNIDPVSGVASKGPPPARSNGTTMALLGIAGTTGVTPSRVAVMPSRSSAPPTSRTAGRTPRGQAAIAAACDALSDTASSTERFGPLGCPVDDVQVPIRRMQRIPDPCLERVRARSAPRIPDHSCLASGLCPTSRNRGFGRAAHLPGSHRHDGCESLSGRRDLCAPTHGVPNFGRRRSVPGSGGRIGATRRIPMGNAD